MKVQFHTDIDFNPRGLHANSGVRQWENETLVAVHRYLNTTRGGYRVIELPVRATIVHVATANGRKLRFDTAYQAECWIERNYPTTVITVQPEDIGDEIKRRKAEEEAERLADDEAWAYEADDNSYGTAKWS